MVETEQQQEATERQFVGRQTMIHGHMQRKRQGYEGFMAETAAMFCPELYMRPGNTLQPGRRFGEDIWDGYPQLALHTWSRGIPGNMIHVKDPWFKMEINVADLMDEPEVRQYCEERTEQVVYGLRRTNFYKDNAQFCRYAGAVGGYLFPIVNPKKRSLYFYLEDPFYVWVERDIFGEMIRCHREFTTTAQALADDFGMESLHPNHVRMLRGGDPYQEVKVLHGIFVNPQYDAFSLDAAHKPYVEFYIDQSNRHLIYHTGCDYMALDWCVERAPRMAYPLTPAMFALTDSYGTDTLSKSLFQVALEAGNPQMRASKTLRATYKEGPGAITWIDDSVREIVEQVRKKLEWPVSDSERAEIVRRVDLWFSVPYWRMLSAMNDTSSFPTAYQVREVQAEKATLLGPQVGTYTAEVLDVAVDIVSQYEAANEPIEMPDILQAYLAYQARRDLARMGFDADDMAVIEHANKHPAAYLEAQYTGALTQIQAQTIHARKYGDGLAAMQMITEQWPEAKHIVNPYPLTRNILEAANWSQEEMKTKEEYEMVVAILQQQEDLMQQMEMEKAGAESYAKLVQAPERGSPAEQAA